MVAQNMICDNCGKDFEYWHGLTCGQTGAVVCSKRCALEHSKKRGKNPIIHKKPGAFDGC